MAAGRIELEGSGQDTVMAARLGYRAIRPLNRAELAETATVTLLLRENPEGISLPERLAELRSLPIAQRRYLSREELAAEHGYTAADRDEVARWAAQHGLSIIEENQATRRVRVEGSLDQLRAAFHVDLRAYERRDADGTAHTYRDHVANAAVPANLGPIVQGVVGLSNRPAARAHYRLLPATAPRTLPRVSYDMGDVARIYNFPGLPNDGEGMELVFGIAELGGAVNKADLAAFQKLIPGLTVIEEGVDGAVPTADPQGADVEVALDWQGIAKAIAAVAPKAKITIVVKYAPNTDQGFVDVEAAFAADGRNYLAVSTSWGERLDNASAATVAAMEASVQAGAARGASYTFAAGDNGSDDGTHDGRLIPDWPSTSAHGTGVGGTSLAATGTVRDSEEVWNDAATGHGEGGGGVDTTQPVPAWQSTNGVTPTSEDPTTSGQPGRGAPDVSFVADPLTGVQTVYNGATMTVGGTSYGAPAVAALFGLLGALNGTSLGEVNPALYALAASGKGFNDISVGGNNSSGPAAGPYQAKPGAWDAASGLGTPRGDELAAALVQQVPTPAPSPPPSPAVALKGTARAKPAPRTL